MNKMLKVVTLSVVLAAVTTAHLATAQDKQTPLLEDQKVRPLKPFDFYSSINCEEDTARIVNHQNGLPIIGQAGEASYSGDILNGIGNTSDNKELTGKVWCPVDMSVDYLDYGHDGNYYGVRVWAADRNFQKGEHIQCRMFGSNGLEDLSNFSDWDNLFNWEATKWVTTGAFDGNPNGTGTTGGWSANMNTDDPDMLDMFFKDTYEFTWFTCEIPWKYKTKISTILGYSYGIFGDL